MSAGQNQARRPRRRRPRAAALLLVALLSCTEPEEMTWGAVAYELGEISCEETIVLCGAAGSLSVCAEHVRWHMCEPWGTCDMLVDSETAGVALTVCRRAVARRSAPDCNSGGVVYLPEDCDRVLALDPKLGWE